MGELTYVCNTIQAKGWLDFKKLYITLKMCGCSPYERDG